jgi:hypothetical protein
MIDIGDTIPVVVLSVDEPQLERAMASIQGQRFAPVIHVNNMAPQAKANNCANRMLAERGLDRGWVLWTAGDMILYDDALDRIAAYMQAHVQSDRVVEVTFGLEDTFLERAICGCPLRRMDVYAGTTRKDVMGNDFLVRRELEKKGYVYQRPCEKGFCIGTHFDAPTVFQIFRRFRARGIKARNNRAERARYGQMLIDLHNKYPDQEQYRQALSAFSYGIGLEARAASHNIAQDQKEFPGWLSNEKETQKIFDLHQNR